MWMLMLLFFVQLQEHAVDNFNSPSYIVQKNTETLPYCANPISKWSPFCSVCISSYVQVDKK